LRNSCKYWNKVFTFVLLFDRDKKAKIRHLCCYQISAHTKKYILSPNVSERFEVAPSMACLSHRSKMFGLFLFTHLNMEKDFKIAAQYVAVWIFFGLCAVLLLQAWGILPLTKF
jgi:hypothetical protein